MIICCALLCMICVIGVLIMAMNYIDLCNVLVEYKKQIRELRNEVNMNMEEIKRSIPTKAFYNGEIIKLK